GDAVGLSTTVTFLSLILWAFVLGPLGALLAIPLSLFTRALLVDSDPGAKWTAALISGEAQETTPPREDSAVGTGRPPPAPSRPPAGPTPPSPGSAGPDRAGPPGSAGPH